MYFIYFYDFHGQGIIYLFITSFEMKVNSISPAHFKPEITQGLMLKKNDCIT